MSHGGPGPGRRGGPSFMKDKERARSTKNLLGLLWRYLRAYKIQLIVTLFLILIYTLASTFSPVIIKDAIDQVTNITADQSLLYTAIILFVVLSAAMWIFNSLSTWVIAKINADLVDDLRKDIFDHLVNADMKYHHTSESGNITSRVVNDTQEITTGLSTFTSGGSQLLLLITTFLIIMSINWTFAAIALLAIPVAMLLTGVIGTIGKKRMLKVRQAYGNTSAKLAEALEGVAISKSFNREEKTSKQIKDLNEEQYQYMLKLGQLFVLIFPAVSMVSTTMIALVLLVGGFINASSGIITVGGIYLGTVMVQRFLMPVLHISQSFTQLQASLAALDRIADVLDAEATITSAKGKRQFNECNSTQVVIDNVTFEYNEGEPVLENISFIMEEGEKTALVGHTGAGKTTLAALVIRFYDPLKGSVSIGGIDLQDLSLESLQNNVSIVTQDPYLFNDTVLENIRYGKEDATDKEIKELCTLIGADEFIQALPDGYQTVLKESGKSISAGQRQMITIARTWLSDPKILILDEATSRLDAYSESLVQRAQKKLFENRTTLVIAHRLSTIRDVDKIVVLEEGKLIEQGTHEELMKKEGKYYELYKTYYAHQGVQSLEELIDSAKYSKFEDLDLETPSPHKKGIRQHMNPEQMEKMKKKMERTKK